MGDMTKQQFIHLHGLLAEVSKTAEDDFNIDVETPDYNALGTQPTSVHKSRDDHKEAVMMLATEVAEALETAEADLQTA